MTKKKYKDFKRQNDKDRLKPLNNQVIKQNFGLTKGFTNREGKLEIDSIRLHSGTDYLSDDNTIYSTFDFHLVTYKDYGATSAYGGVLRLFNFEYGFELRIFHINPNDLSSDSKKSIANQSMIKKGSKLCVTSAYGTTTSNHSHIMLVSLDETCPLFESIISNTFEYKKEEYDKDYSVEEIEQAYRELPKYKNVDIEMILLHFESIKKKKRITGICNRFKYQGIDYYSNKEVTFYSFDHLFKI